ncbi:MATE family efflux transporter [Novosphingobium sp. Gsoil 351]|uniref:MATE family efflux transporter n=1 Tax=Novosphingobium sp. Gsoil 351 TaxID=2675225 RepID=UPI0012B47B45|nr:MATE family efflux transporter [Novosphingobium sp. Gsoil 351]QGN55279.1 MATE family efflux transporter [Novosphingobium sp. Gsoil 351]
MSDFAPIDSPGPQPAEPDDPRLKGPSAKGDLTRGPILRTLIVFAIPALISNIVQTINGSINTVWVGRLLGENALAATANANTLMFLTFGTVFGFGMATTVLVGQKFGARDIPGAREAFGGGVGFCTGLSAVIATLGWIFAPQLLHLMSTPPEAQPLALSYLRVIMVSMPFGVLAMMVSMGLRGAGDATTPMRATILTVVLDVIFNPLLILGIGPLPRLGIAGSALSSALASAVGAGVMIWRVYAKDLPLRLRGRELRFLKPSMEELSYLVGKGLPMGAQLLIAGAAGVVMIGLVNREGLIPAAAYGTSLQLWNYIQMPAIAIGAAITAMVAQNIGAEQHKRVGSITWVGVGLNTAITAVVTALILLFDRPVLELFLGGGSPAVPLARHIQFIVTWSFLLMGVMMVLFSTMRAYGAVYAPLGIMFVALYPGRIGFYALAYPVIGQEAVWWSYPFGSTISMSLALAYYRWGPWRKRRVAARAEMTPVAAE